MTYITLPIDHTNIIHRYLLGLHYPATRDVLVELAEQQGAPRSVLRLLATFHRWYYESPLEVADEFLRIEQETENAHP